MVRKLKWVQATSLFVAYIHSLIEISKNYIDDNNSYNTITKYYNEDCSLLQISLL